LLAVALTAEAKTEPLKVSWVPVAESERRAALPGRPIAGRRRPTATQRHGGADAITRPRFERAAGIATVAATGFASRARQIAGAGEPICRGLVQRLGHRGVDRLGPPSPAKHTQVGGRSVISWRSSPARWDP